MIKSAIIEMAIASGDKLGRKFDDMDIIEDPELGKAAAQYVQEYNGSFEYLLQLKQKLQEFGSLTSAQARGALNCLMADIRRERTQTTTGVQLDLQTEKESTPEVVEVVVYNGIYTVDFGDGTHTTIKLTTCKYPDMPRNTQVAAFLSGPDNERNYRGFAFVFGKKMKLWKSANNERLKEALQVLLKSDNPDEYGRAYALKSNNCYRCGRTLTVPFSIYQGLGPICAGREE